MKTSLLCTLAIALVLTGCSKSTRTNSAASNDTSATTTPSSDYAATSTPKSSTPATTADQMANDMRSATSTATTAVTDAAHNVATTARMAEWKLNASDIQADLDNNREIVRTRDSAGAPTGSTDKSMLESLVKGRLAADSDIAALKLDVDAKKDGEIKLSGKAHSADQVGKAIALALDTEGVLKVTSSVKLDKEAKTMR
jgi:hypothetical protein